MSIKLLNDKLSNKTSDEICDYLNKPYYHYLIKKLLGKKNQSVHQKTLIGMFFHFVEKNYDSMKKYYLMAVDKGDRIAMCNFGCYYHDIEEYDLMKKYYNMAVDKGESFSMNNLGYYYKTIEKNYEEAKKILFDGY
jgi:hypothetical protein